MNHFIELQHRKDHLCELVRPLQFCKLSAVSLDVQAGLGGAAGDCLSSVCPMDHWQNKQTVLLHCA